MFEIIGKITVGFVALVFLLVIAYNIYLVIRALVLAADFLRWCIGNANRADTAYKLKDSVIKAYFDAFRAMYDYDANTTITHNNGAVYKPFSRV